MNKINFIVSLVFLGFFSCNTNSNEPDIIRKELLLDSLISDSSYNKTLSDSVVTTYHDTDLVDVETIINKLPMELVYATDSNFLKEKVYDCPKCYLRYEAAVALRKVDGKLKEKGLRIKVFDCLRPFSVQKIMWEVLPDSRYVANPNKNGSIHNRGGAIDLTLSDINGNNVDMGTAFDHFGVESHHSYAELDSSTLANRKLLKEAMEAAGFKPLATEWWHYSFKSNYSYSIADKKFECE
jgi:D-alanyl-D-alanine dipeptidase